MERTEPRGWLRHRATILALLTAVLFLGVPGAALAAPEPHAGAGSSPAAASIAWVNISATSSFAFVPGTVHVDVGQEIRLAVTQMANFEHTFTLSPAANVTIPAGSNDAAVTAFFRANPPLVNLSLGSVPGVTTRDDFAAPPLGTYEFVCVQPSHFESGMFGFLVVEKPGTSSSGGPSTNTWILYGSLAAVGAVAIIAGVWLLSRRRRQAPPSGGAPKP